MEIKNKNIIYTETRKVKCDGLNQELGHPLVYLNIKKDKIFSNILQLGLIGLTLTIGMVSWHFPQSPVSAILT